MHDPLQRRAVEGGAGGLGQVEQADHLCRDEVEVGDPVPVDQSRGGPRRRTGAAARASRHSTGHRGRRPTGPSGTADRTRAGRRCRPGVTPIRGPIECGDQREHLRRTADGAERRPNPLRPAGGPRCVEHRTAPSGVVDLVVATGSQHLLVGLEPVGWVGVPGHQERSRWGDTGFRDRFGHDRGPSSIDDDRAGVRVGEHVGHLSWDPVPVDRHQQPAPVRAGQRDLDELDLVAEHGEHRVARDQAPVTQRMDEARDPLVELEPCRGAALVDDRGLAGPLGDDPGEDGGHDDPGSGRPRREPRGVRSHRRRRHGGPPEKGLMPSTVAIRPLR